MTTTAVVPLLPENTAMFEIGRQSEIWWLYFTSSSHSDLEMKDNVSDILGHVPFLIHPHVELFLEFCIRGLLLKFPFVLIGTA
jgi:hypothetical protein